MGAYTALHGATAPSLLAAAGGSPLMLIRVAGQWHESNSLAATEQADQKRLHVGFAGSKITAQAVVRPRGQYFEVETVALEGPGAEAVEQWIFVNLPVNITVNIGPWLNIAWNDSFAVAVIALEERTEASGSPTLRGTAHRGLGLVAAQGGHRRLPHAADASAASSDRAGAPSALADARRPMGKDVGGRENRG